MSGTIRTYQRCPRCGAPFPSSKGGFPIICNPCQTQPTKYFIDLWWKGCSDKIYHDLNGKTFHNWNHVAAVMGEIRGKMDRGSLDPSAYKKQSSTSFSAFWGRFLSQDRYSGPTRDKIKAIGKHHLAHFADMQMNDIVPWHLDEWWRQLQKKGLSNNYCNQIQIWLRAFFNNAKKLKIPITIDPKNDFPAFLKTEDPEIEWLTEQEQLAVLGVLPKDDRPIYDFLFLTGARVNEACALQRSDINYQKRTVTIRNTIKRNGDVGIVKNKKPRRIPLAAVAHCFKEDIISIRGFVFINKWGRRYSDDYLRETFYKACDKAGVKRIKLKNATRHSFGMGLRKKGYDAWQISKIMNHSDIKITEHYIEMLDQEISGAYGRINHDKTTTNTKNKGFK